MYMDGTIDIAHEPSSWKRHSSSFRVRWFVRKTKLSEGGPTVGVTSHEHHPDIYIYITDSSSRRTSWAGFVCASWLVAMRSTLELEEVVQTKGQSDHFTEVSRKRSTVKTAVRIIPDTDGGWIYASKVYLDTKHLHGVITVKGERDAAVKRIRELVNSCEDNGKTCLADPFSCWVTKTQPRALLTVVPHYAKKKKE